ncbi:MAG: CopG family transcriptional regulator [Deltaproteobacteria bacterium]|nr:CopG family transcriptional regulator [Deltaproteobacteria bacterium]
MKKKDADEAKDTVKCTVKLPVELWRAARHRAIDEDRDFQEVVADALKLYLGPRTMQSLKGGKS